MLALIVRVGAEEAITLRGNTLLLTWLSDESDPMEARVLLH